MTSLESAPDEEEVLLNRYENVEWEEDVTQFRCTRCAKVLVQHFIANCEHKFCPNCKRVLGDGSERWRCPGCGQFIRLIERQDQIFRDRVKDLRLRCPHRKYGCDHVCALREMKIHLEQCQYTRENALPVLCNGEDIKMIEQMFELRVEMREMRQKMMVIEKECKDEKAEMRQKMLQMEMRCKDEKDKMEEKLIDLVKRMDDLSLNLQEETAHLNEKILKMKTNEMDEKITLKVEENKSKIVKLECKQEMWFEMCDVREKQLSKDIQEAKHDFQQDLQNLNILTENHDKLSNEMKLNETAIEGQLKILDNYITLIKPQIQFLYLTETYHRMEDGHTWVINDLKNALEHKLKVKSGVFPLKGYSFGAEASMDLARDSFQVDLSFLDLKKRRKPELAISPRVYFTLKDRSGSAVVKDRSISYASGFHSAIYYDYFENYNFRSFPKTCLNDPLYNVDDQVSIVVHVEPPEVAQLAYSYDGTLEWAVHDYWRMKKEQREGLLECHVSPYFYTGAEGYRAQVKLRVGDEDSLWVQVDFLRGQFDADLTEDYPHRTTVTFFHPADPSRKLTQTIEEDKVYRVNTYKVDMGSEKDIENMILNDNLHYRVVIEALMDIEGPLKDQASG